MTTVRVTKIDFSPSIEERFRNRDSDEPLKVFIHGCMKNLKSVCIEMTGARPRFGLSQKLTPLRLLVERLI